MLVNLIGGPLHGQTKNIKQRDKEFPNNLTWPTADHKGARYDLTAEGSRVKPAEFKYRSK